MRRRITMVAAVMAACLAMPAMPAGAAQPSTGGTTLATVVSAPSASIGAATRKPRASLSVTLGQSATGRPQVRATSNAKKVRVAYRTAKGTKRAVTKKLRKSRATITLPTGARSIRVRAKATARLAASPWVVAAVPVIAPVVAPPAPIVAPLLPPPPPTPIGYGIFMLSGVITP